MIKFLGAIVVVWLAAAFVSYYLAVLRTSTSLHRARQNPLAWLFASTLFFPLYALAMTAHFAIASLHLIAKRLAKQSHP